MQGERIKVDTKAKIANKGLLGDKMIEITKGKEPTVRKPGEIIPVDTTPGLLDRMSGIGDKANDTLDIK